MIIMENSYSIDDYIEMLEEIIRNATRIPFKKKSMVDVDELDNIVTDMRMVLPMEIQQAKKVVADKNKIISDAKKEAEDIIRKAEQRRAELIEESDVMKEARRRATEAISVAQNRAKDIHTSTNAFADNMLARVEELMARDLNDLRLLRKNINAAGNVQASPAQQPPAKPGTAPAPQNQKK